MKDENVFLACHELGHCLLIQRHFGNVLDEEGVWIDTTKIGKAFILGCYNGSMVAEVLRSFPDEMAKASLIRDRAGYHSASWWSGRGISGARFEPDKGDQVL